MTPQALTYPLADDGWVWDTPMDADTPEECREACGKREHPDMDPDYVTFGIRCRCILVGLH